MIWNVTVLCSESRTSMSSRKKCKDKKQDSKWERSWGRMRIPKLRRMGTGEVPQEDCAGMEDYDQFETSTQLPLREHQVK